MQVLAVTIPWFTNPRISQSTFWISSVVHNQNQFLHQCYSHRKTLKYVDSWTKYKEKICKREVILLLCIYSSLSLVCIWHFFILQFLFIIIVIFFRIHTRIVVIWIIAFLSLASPHAGIHGRPYFPQVQHLVVQVLEQLQWTTFSRLEQHFSSWLEYTGCPQASIPILENQDHPPFPSKPWFEHSQMRCSYCLLTEGFVVQPGKGSCTWATEEGCHSFASLLVYDLSCLTGCDECICTWFHNWISL